MQVRCAMNGRRVALAGEGRGELHDAGRVR